MTKQKKEYVKLNWARRPGRYLDEEIHPEFRGNIAEWYGTLIYLIINKFPKESTDLICGPEIQCIFEMTNEWQANLNKKLGFEGSFDRFKVHVNPYMTRNLIVSLDGHTVEVENMNG